MEGKKCFTCSPKEEPFCCFTERITLLPSEIRKNKVGWEGGGVLIPSFRGIFRKSSFSKKQLASAIDLVELEQVPILVKMELIFFPLVPVEEFSDNFKIHLKHLGLNGNLAFRCPFLGNRKCSIYRDRPLFCRLFPVSIYGPLGEHLRKCLECGGLRVLGGKSINKQIKVNRKELLRRRKDIEEWKKIVKKLFTDKNVVFEALRIMNDVRSDREFLINIIQNPNILVPLITAIPRIYNYFSIDIDKQVSIAERAWKLAEKCDEPVFLGDCKFICNSLKQAASGELERIIKPITAGLETERLLKALEEVAIDRT